MIDLTAEFSRLLPKAVEWAERQQQEILRTGIVLSPEEIEIAKRVGVIPVNGRTGSDLKLYNRS